MRLFALALLLTFFSSCYENKTCESGYIGYFYIDTTLLNDSAQKFFVTKYRWDTVKLISTNDGSYHFACTDKILRAAEGTWYTKSDDIEGNCFGYVKQNNLNVEIMKSPFDIMLMIKDTLRFNLPFRKRIKTN